MIYKIIHTVCAKILLSLFLMGALPIILVCLLIPRSWLAHSRLFFKGVHLFYWAVLKCSFLPISYSGLENLPDNPAIFAANHQSTLDIPLIGYVVYAQPHIWLAKQELRESILIKYVLPLLAVTVDMRTPAAGMRTIRGILKAAKPADNLPEKHIMIFPEGGRYIDGDVHEFFSGFAVLARKMNRPVIPIKIINAYRVYPPDTFWMSYHPIEVIVGPAFFIQNEETDQQFVDRVFEWFCYTKKNNNE